MSNIEPEQVDKELAKLLLKLNIDEQVPTDVIVEALQKATRFFKKQEKKELRGKI